MKKKNFSLTYKAYLAGLLDGDGSIYVRAKRNSTYRYGFQIACYVAFFQSNKKKNEFKTIFLHNELGKMRERNDGILEYVINRKNSILKLIENIKPFLILKKKQAFLLIKILKNKEKVKSKKDFENLLKLIDGFRELNYSKKAHIITP